MRLPTILLVDDSEVYLTLEKELLSRSAVLILTAGNGQDALAAARQNRPDLIVIGLAMAGMNGVDCCRAIRSDPDLSGIPIIVVAPADTAADRERCSRAGVNGYLAIPFTRHEFLDTARCFIPEIDRREQRISWRVPVSVTIANQQHPATSEDLSLNGMYLSASHAVAVNEPVTVRFVVDESRNEWIAAHGAVAWTNPRHAPKSLTLPEGFGVQFLSLTDDDRVRLLHFLRTRVA